MCDRNRNRRCRLRPEQRKRADNRYRCRYCGRLCLGADSLLPDKRMKDCACALCLERLGVTHG